MDEFRKQDKDSERIFLAGFEEEYGAERKEEFLAWLAGISEKLDALHKPEGPEKGAMERFAEFFHTKSEFIAHKTEAALSDNMTTDSRREDLQEISKYLGDFRKDYDIYSENLSSSWPDWKTVVPDDEIKQRTSDEMAAIKTELGRLADFEKNGPDEDEPEYDDDENEVRKGDTSRDESFESENGNNVISTHRRNGSEINDDDIVINAKPNIRQLIDEKRRGILRCAKQLEKAKTVFNSSEYNRLVTAITAVGEGNTKDIPGITDPKEKFAQELYSVHKLVEDYLEHKSRDGVKNNCYKKLIAVDWTNNFLSQCFNDLGNTKLRRNSGDDTLPQDTDSMVVTAEERLSVARTKLGMEAKLPRFEDNYRQYASMCMNNRPEMRQYDERLIKDCIEGVDNTMTAIMIKARMRNDDAAYNTFNTMRERFLLNPFPPIKKEEPPQRQNEAPVLR